MIARRRLLVGSIAVAGFGLLGLWQIGPAAIRTVIESVLRRRLEFLRLDEDGVQAFAKDQTDRIFAKRVSLGRIRYHVVATVGSSFKRFERSTDKRSSSRRTEDFLVSTYLLSTDFFLNGSDETHTVRYLGYYDPLHPCGNPFARSPVAGKRVGENI